MADFPENSVAIVTGGASGVGLASATALLNSSITSLALLDIDASSLEIAVSSLTTRFPTVTILPIVLDVSTEAAVNDAITKVVEKFGQVDFLVNAAGTTGLQSRTDGTESEAADAVWGVNARGLWLVERAFIRQLLKQEARDVVVGGGSALKLTTRGAIVNVGSLTSNIAIANLAPYVMSKHAVLGLTKADAVDYAKDGIRINAVAVGCVKSKLTQILWEEGPGKAIGDAFVSRAPMNRWAAPEEVAQAILFLLSDKASFITGSCLNIDGGYCAM